MGSWPPQQADMAQWQVAIQEQVLLHVVLMVSAGPGYRLQDDLKPGSHATSHTFYIYRTAKDTFVCLFFCIKEGKKSIRDAGLLSVLRRVHILNHVSASL